MTDSEQRQHKHPTRIERHERVTALERSVHLEDETVAKQHREQGPELVDREELNQDRDDHVGPFGGEEGMTAKVRDIDDDHSPDGPPAENVETFDSRPNHCLRHFVAHC
jgi:hypothetical protein